MESSYLNADLVRESPTKKCVVIDGGEYVEGEFQGKTYEKFQLTIEIDGKQKKWSPNKDTVRSIASELGKDSKNWIGAIIKLQVGKSFGKDTILGMAMPQN